MTTIGAGSIQEELSRAPPGALNVANGDNPFTSRDWRIRTMASTILKNLYRKARKAGVGCIVGESALSAWRTARILRQWESLEDLGLVRLIAEPDESWEPGCACGDPRCASNNPDSEAFGAIGQFRMPMLTDCHPSDSRWKTADSVWGCVGYRDVLDWRENAYVIDIMAETIRAFQVAWKDRVHHHCPTCHRPMANVA